MAQNNTLFELKLIFGEDIYKTGIYKFYFKSSPEYFYVGRAKSNGKFKCQKGFYKRWSKHLNDFEKNKHVNVFLQRLFNKHGVQELNFEILETCPVELCNQKELDWFEKLKPLTNFQSNKKFKAKECSPLLEETILKRKLVRLGVKHSEKTKQKISQAHLGVTGYKKILSEDVVFGIVDNILFKNQTVSNQSKLKRHSLQTVKNSIKIYFYEIYENILLISKSNMYQKISISNRNRQSSKNNEVLINYILNYYRAGKLISEIKKLVNCNEDLIGQIIKQNMSDNERKQIRSRNAVRNNSRKY